VLRFLASAFSKSEGLSQWASKELDLITAETETVTKDRDKAKEAPDAAIRI
jgi:hypothetical protein